MRRLENELLDKLENELLDNLESGQLARQEVVLDNDYDLENNNGVHRSGRRKEEDLPIPNRLVGLHKGRVIASGMQLDRSFLGSEPRLLSARERVNTI